MPVLHLEPHLWAGRKIGLLGGSFNPAHAGHRHISLYALKYLKLDAVWWMVSPQNPLKSSSDTAPLAERLAGAASVADHPRIYVTDIESRLNTRYTIDTLRALKARFAATSFVWLMGSDNLHQFHRWKKWQTICDTVPVCVLARPPAGNALRQSRAGAHLASRRLRESDAACLPESPLPAWTVLNIPLNPLSSTDIRAARRG